MSDHFSRIFQPDAEESWDEEEPQYYPGSKMVIPEAPPPPRAKPMDDDPWDLNPKVLLLNGVEVEFFPISALARAVGKSSKTIREWERIGVLPKARYRSRHRDPAKAYRLYSRAQIEGIRRIAGEEGMLTWKPANIQASNFTARVVALFHSLETGVSGEPPA